MKNLGLCLTLVACVATALEAKRLLGAEKCTWGPSYWCSGLKPSRECNSVTSLCIKKVWNKNPYPEDNDDVCTICKNMVKEARDQLESNETQTELKEVFEGSCALIPIKIIADECKTLVDEFVPELVETLSSEMNPDTVCSVAGLCNSKKIDKLLAKFSHQHSSSRFLSLRRPSSDCDTCKNQAKILATKIYNADKDEVVDKVLEMCGYTGPYADACRIMVLENFDDIYDVLIHLDDGICDLSGMCPSSGKAAFTSKGEDLQCEFCEKVIQHYIDTWTANTTVEEFKQVLEALCHKLKADRVDRCLHIIDDYYLPWFNFILHELNPKTACTLLGLCGDTPVSSATLALEAPTKQPKIIFTGNDETALSLDTTGLIGGYFAPKTAIILDKPGCAICEFVVEELRKIIGQSKTEEEIGQALTKVCSIMPSSVKDQCDHLVDTYGPAIVEILSRGVEPKEVCSMMQLCGSQLMANVMTNNPIAEIKEKDDNCALCQFAMQTLYTILDNKDNEEEIKNALETLCRYMPSSIEDKCEEYVDSYSELIIQFILKNMTPEQICSQLGLCKTATPSVVKTFTPNDNRCTLCEFAIGSMDRFLANATTEAEVQKTLRGFCAYFHFHDQCDQFVDEYTSVIVDYVTHQISAKEVCEKMGLCQEAVTRGSTQSFLDGGECNLCKFGLSSLDRFLSGKTTDEEVNAALHTFCGYFKFHEQCDAFADKFTPLIVSYLTRQATADEVCEKMGLCKPTPKPQISLTRVEVECVKCELVMSALDDIIDGRTDESYVRSALESVCQDLPFLSTCSAFINQYGDFISDLLTHKISPQNVCEQLAACEAQETYAEQFQMLSDVDSLVRQAEAPAHDGRPYCTLCEYAIGEVDKMITDKQNEEEIKSVLDRICYELSAPIQKECLNMVTQYTDEIIEMFVANYTPQQVCAQLGLCDAPSQPGLRVESNAIPADINDNPLCLLCEFAMSIVEKQILTNRTLDMVEHAVEMVCSYMPQSVSDQCIDFVQKYGDEIIDLIIKAEMNPDQVCAELTLCTSVKTWDASPLGGQRCTWGPAFWCQSKIHAKACGTLEHCEKNVWNNE